MRTFVALLLCLFSHWATAAAPTDMTPIRTEHFKVDLPGIWSVVPTTDVGLWQYSNESQGEELSVSVLKVADSATPNERAARLNEYLNARLKVEREQAHPAKIELTTPKIESQGNSLVASYSGFQSDTDRRFVAFAIFNSKRLVCFYFETLRMKEAEFKKRQAAVIGTVQVAD